MGTAATAGLIGIFAHFVLGLEWTLAALIAVALSPTDPAAVYATLRGRDQFQRAKVVLEGESGFNDPVSISLMVAVVAFVSSDHATVAESAVHLVQELGLGLVGGIVGAGVLIVLLRATPQLEEALQSIAVLVMVVVIGAATAVVHGSGFLAVYVAGLLFADRWAGQDGAKHAIPESLSAAAEPVLFGLLGAVYAPRLTGGDVIDGAVLTLVTFCVLRPAIVLALPESQPLHTNREARGHARRAERSGTPPSCRLRRSRSSPAGRPHRSSRVVGHSGLDPRTGMGALVHHIQTNVSQIGDRSRDTGPVGGGSAWLGLTRCPGRGRQLHRDPEADQWVRGNRDEAAGWPVEIEGHKEKEGEHPGRDEDGDDAA